MKSLSQTIITLATLLKRQSDLMQYLENERNNKDVIERRSTLTSIYDILFPKSSFLNFAIKHQAWTNHQNNMELKFASPNVKKYKDDFLELSSLTIHCSLINEEVDYTFIMPINRHNVELYLQGILTTSKKTNLLPYLDACLIKNPKGSKTSSKWSTSHADFSTSLPYEEQNWIEQLTEFCFKSLEDFNVLHLQEMIIRGKLCVSLSELELLKTWSDFDTHYKDNKDNFIFNSFENFYQWAMITGYTTQKRLSIKNQDEGFSPTNCEWVAK